MKNLILLFTLWITLSSIVSTNSFTLRFINDRDTKASFEFYSTDAQGGWHVLKTYDLLSHDTLDLELPGYNTLYGYREVSNISIRTLHSVFKIQSNVIRFK